MRQVVLIDGKNFCYRQHYTHRMLSSRGRPTSVIYGCLSGLLSMAGRLPGVPLVFVWEGGGKTWRHELLNQRFKEIRKDNEEKRAQGIVVEEKSSKKPEGYKANRDRTKSEHQIVQEQVVTLRRFLEDIGMRNFRVPKMEADDLIGILSHTIVKKELFDRVIICSSDRDFYQLMSDKVKVWNPRDKKTKSHSVKFITEDDVMEEFGIESTNWIKLRALMGDSSDNIPQIKAKVGPVTAAKMVLAGLDPSFPDFENNSAQVKEQYADLKPLWPHVHQNYLLCRIIKKPSSKMLPDEVKKNAIELTEYLTRRDFTRNKDVQTDKTYHWMMKWFGDYELTEMIIRSRELWQLP